jgi:hypothetical protein
MKKILFLGLMLLTLICKGQDSLFTNSEIGTNPQLDNQAIELGVTFNSAVAGKISHIRFYKTIKTDASVYTVNLWTATGIKLATKQISLSGKNGWQSVALDIPVTIQPGVNYVASFQTIQGRYCEINDFYSVARTRGNLTAPKGSSSVPNGRYVKPSGFPNKPYLNSNYCVDVVFQPLIQKPLFIQTNLSLPDSTVFLPIDNLTRSFKLEGIVTGNDPRFKWLMEYVDYGIGPDTIRRTISTTSLSPVVDSLQNGVYLFRLQATDVWGSSGEASFYLFVEQNPKQPVITIYQAGKASIFLLRDGTLISADGQGMAGKWLINGSTQPGFLSEWDNP